MDDEIQERWGELEELAEELDFEVAEDELGFGMAEQDGSFSLMGHDLAFTGKKTLEGVEQAVAWLTAYGDENYDL